MSSLQCAARILVARHGEAEYETELCSDDGGSLTALGRQQARELADLLSGERIARVWTSSLSRAVQTAEIVAASLGVDVVVREGLREYGVGSLAGTTKGEQDYFAGIFRQWAEGDDTTRIDGGERISDFVARVGGVLDEVADSHPGETTLVVSHGGAILATLPQLVGLPRTHGLGVALRQLRHGRAREGRGRLAALLAATASADGLVATRLAARRLSAPGAESAVRAQDDIDLGESVGASRRRRPPDLRRGRRGPAADERRSRHRAGQPGVRADVRLLP